MPPAEAINNRPLRIEEDQEGYLSVPITLGAGEGKLLAVDASGRQ